MALFGRPSQKKQTSADHRVHVQLKELIKCEHLARGFSFRSLQPVQSPLNGRHASRLRGRGLNFEELRHYRVGDDIRTMDWKVTNRTKKPHVRVYTEERERKVFILLDQRISMFFGSAVAMKSVVAAEIAALVAWRVTALGDKIGAVVFNDSQVYAIRPQRSRHHVMRLLSKITELNGELKAGTQGNGKQQNIALKKLLPLLSHDSLVILISDGNGWSAAESQNIRRLSQHNDLIAVNIVDAGEQKIPALGQLIISDGNAQISIDSNRRAIQTSFQEQQHKRLGNMECELKRSNIPLISINTGEPTHTQLIRALGGQR